MLKKHNIKGQINTVKTKQKSITNAIRFTCLFVFIGSAFIYANSIDQLSGQQSVGGRILEFQDQYLAKKEQYSRQRKSFLKGKSQFQGLQLIESNLAYGEQISQQLKELERQEYSRLDSIYHFDDFDKELPFCVIVQNLDFTTPFLFELTLNSIFSQKYLNYKAIIYNYGEAGNSLIIQYFKVNRIKKEHYLFIKNTENKSIIQNILSASSGHCQKNSVSLNIVGNIELVGKNVLKTFNAAYQNSKIGMAYSNFYHYNQGKSVIEGFNMPYHEKDLQKIRQKKFGMSTSVTYLTEYILKIKPQDLQDSKGIFLDMVYEQAIFFPLIDILCRKVAKIDGYHTAVHTEINSYKSFKQSIKAKSEASLIARTKPNYICDQKFNTLITHKKIVFHKQYLIDKPDLEQISEKRTQKQGTIKTPKEVKNYDVTPQKLSKLGQYLYNNKKILKARLQFQQQRISFINSQVRENSRQMIKYNLRLGTGLDKQQAKTEEYQSYQAHVQHQLSKYSTEQVPFCIVLQDLSFQAAYVFRFQHVLNSIFNQNYTNFFTVIINRDPHMDEYIRKYLHYNQINKQRYVYLENYQNRSPIEMLDNAVTNYCSYDSYLMLLEGSGEYVGKNGLKIFNKYFQERNLGFVYSDSYFVINNEARLRYGSSQEYTDDEKNQGKYRNNKKKYQQPFAFKTEFFLNIDPKDFKNEEGKYIEGNVEAHIILSALQMSCAKVNKVSGIHYLINQEVKKSKPDWEKSFMIKKKKEYKCLKDAPILLKMLDLTQKPELKDITQKQIQKGGITAPKKVRQFDFLMKNDQGLRIDEYLYNSKIISRQRKRYQIERQNFLSTKTTEYSRQLIQFNLMIEGRRNEKQSQLEQQDNAIIKKTFKGIEESKEVPICVILDHFSFNIPYKFELTLNSIFSQHYSNYFVVIFGDGSQEGDILLRKYLYFYKIPRENFVYLPNKNKKGTLENTIDAVNNYCSKDSLVVNIAGEDEFIGKKIFKIFSHVNQKENALLLYSNSYYYNQGSKIDLGKASSYTDAEINKNSYRQIQQKFQKPIFYHSELFRKIDKKDLMFSDKDYYNNGLEKAIVIPMLEMSCGRVKQVEGVHYLINIDKAIKIDENQKKKQEQKVLKGKKYNCANEFKNDV